MKTTLMYILPVDSVEKKYRPLSAGVGFESRPSSPMNWGKIERGQVREKQKTRPKAPNIISASRADIKNQIIKNDQGLI